MEKIDYSKFYINYKNAKPKSAECTKIPKEKRYKLPKISSAGLMLLLLLCFALTLTFATLVGNNGILSVFGENNKMYYYSVYYDAGTDIAEAKDYSVLVKAGGGGGNLIKQGDNYYVIYATYPDEASAETVKLRGEGLGVLKTEENKMASPSPDSDDYVHNYNELKKAAANTLYETALSYAKQGGKEEIVGVVSALNAEFSDLKKIIDDDKKLTTNEKLSLIVAIDTITGRLEGILYADDGAATLASVWYQMFCII